ncbi:histidine kinase [Nocardioides sp. 1609]|uniref:sensor histidine kinase n=1 Tax=Nocardioides sp. 1609 TaxID=2508327 RepID=UPI001070060B|nr:histidine kinase [Nocardioides sp. 1609]
MDDRVRQWAPTLALSVLVLALGLAEAVSTTYVYSTHGRGALALVATATAGAVAASRRFPGPALALAWLVLLLQLASDTQLMLVQAAFVVVSFASARWGHPLTVLASALSVPGAAFCLVLLVATQDYLPLLDVVGYQALLDTAYRFGDSWRIGAVVIVVGLLGLPWLAGIAMRFSDRARASQASQVRAEEEAARAVRESEQAREIARLRDEQARLARDVHDVVGHSLAVILAQAESGQYLPDDDPARLKQTMATIATSARSSLQEVRAVLTPDAAAGAAPRPLDTLVEGVRAGGHEVVSRELGTPQPLPPELEVVAYRVLQEMLTNAVKHGSRDEPVFVERHWPDGAFAGELRIEVRNTALTRPPAGAGETDDTGRGLDGMRHRLEAVGGRLDVRRRDEDAVVSFTVTAWLPVSRL